MAAAVVVMVSSPVEQSGCWWKEGRLTTSGRLQHKQEGGCSSGLGWTSSHSEPPRGRKEDDNLSPSMALHRLPHCTGSKGVLGQAGLGWAGLQ
ncbi:hypothetical protein AN641_00485 [Candidatus Epulonipiscioides gigas]|nr:hypothetical protein AN641_00485 [Epulopiscium sp. SCG-C07WGA-EpuloA2]